MQDRAHPDVPLHLLRREALAPAAAARLGEIREGVTGIGGLGNTHSPLSDSKKPEAVKLGAHYVHNTRRDGELKKIAGSLDLIISTINVPLPGRA